MNRNANSADVKCLTRPQKPREKDNLYWKVFNSYGINLFFLHFQILNQTKGRELRKSEINYFLNLLLDAFTHGIAKLKQFGTNNWDVKSLKESFDKVIC